MRTASATALLTEAEAVPMGVTEKATSIEGLLSRPRAGHHVHHDDGRVSE
jgi:hypothetical protein